MHMTAQRAHVRVDGPVFVLVVTCSWQWKQVKVTGPSESSVGTTNWVATGGGALYSGPTWWLHAGGGFAPYNLVVLPFCNVPFSARSWVDEEVEGRAILHPVQLYIKLGFFTSRRVENVQLIPAHLELKILDIQRIKIDFESWWLYVFLPLPLDKIFYWKMCKIHCDSNLTRHHVCTDFSKI